MTERKPIPPKPTGNAVHVGSRRTPILLCAALCCALWRVLAYSLWNSEAIYFPGIGLTVTVSILIPVSLWCAKEKDRLHLNAYSLITLVCVWLIALSYALYGGFTMRVLNLPVIFACACWGLYLASNETAGHSLRGLVHCACGFFGRFFASVSVPFKLVPAYLSRHKAVKRTAYSAAGILLFCIVVPLVCILLGSADAVFSSLFKSVGRLLSGFEFGSAIRIIVTGSLLTLILFGASYAPIVREETVQDGPAFSLQPSLFTLTLSALTALFAVFGYIQIKYLFMGREAAVMAGGYAAYARSGFFQLLGVCMIALLVVQPALVKCGNVFKVRALCFCVSAFTLLIVVSAFLRMKLYTDEYGLTLLRVFVQWANLMLFIAFAVTGFKCIRTNFKIFPVISAVLLISWTVLSLCNPPALVANCNVDRYNTEITDYLDLDYLSGLRPASVAAVERIRDAQKRQEALDYLLAEDLSGPSSFEWSLELQKYPFRQRR